MVGSGLTVDRCGRCGGTGECGAGAQYEWVARPASPCGGGDLLLHTLQQRVEPLLRLVRGRVRARGRARARVRVRLCSKE